VVATKIKLRLTVTALTIITGVIVGAGCGVSKDPSAPNAFACNPTSTQLTNFNNTVIHGATGLIANGCASCHGTNYPYRSRFHFDAINSTTAAETENYCISYFFGILSPSQALITHPMDPNHYGWSQAKITSVSQIQNIYDWVNDPNSVLTH
jgi:hypothetical protein